MLTFFQIHPFIGAFIIIVLLILLVAIALFMRNLLRMTPNERGARAYYEDKVASDNPYDWKTTENIEWHIGFKTACYDNDDWEPLSK